MLKLAKVSVFEIKVKPEVVGSNPKLPMVVISHYCEKERPARNLRKNAKQNKYIPFTILKRRYWPIEAFAETDYSLIRYVYMNEKNIPDPFPIRGGYTKGEKYLIVKG